MGKSVQSKFGLNSQDSENISLCVHDCDVHVLIEKYEFLCLVHKFFFLWNDQNLD